MFLKRNCAIFMLIATILFAKSHGQFRSDKPCYVQPLVNIANKTLYFGTNFKGNFFEASNFCRTHCMHLISIESAAEQKGIVDYLTKSPYGGEYIWTSGNDLDKEGEFKWLSTGQRMWFQNWAPGEPNNKVWDGVSENCVGLCCPGYAWNDFVCNREFYFICEIRP